MDLYCFIVREIVEREKTKTVKKWECCIGRFRSGIRDFFFSYVNLRRRSSLLASWVPVRPSRRIRIRSRDSCKRTGTEIIYNQISHHEKNLIKHVKDSYGSRVGVRSSVRSSVGAEAISRVPARVVTVAEEELLGSLLILLHVLLSEDAHGQGDQNQQGLYYSNNAE